MLISRLISRSHISTSCASSSSKSRPANSIIQNLLGRFSQGFCRTNSISATPQYATKKAAYPERLLIYYAGTGKTVFIGCMKVTTIFIFSFICLVVAPAHWFAEDELAWTTGAVILSGAIPMVFVAYTTAPFVNYIHLRLPSFARHSREILMRYSRNLPKDAQLDITTMNFIGKPRVTRVKMAELFPVNERFGLATYARDTKYVNAERPWWMGKAVRQFGITGGAGRIREGGVWENVAASIQKSAESAATSPKKV